MKVNVGKTKVTVFERGEGTTECDILIEGDKAEQVKEFVYLGSLFKNDGQKKNESRINAVETRSLRSMCGVSGNDKYRKIDVRERCGLKDDVVTRVEKGILRRLGHLDE
ncbi:hypothetical protein EVAR_54948_1 [Eumeta japonica]|uniref:Uncharacterized protein n=1 Tax=Eumeta variegata TaxID=151549 RepID=A0A4C1YMR1_EUMVA|nr:hypothetical protein EVAR_54948_1 [Eumeta japonica]